MFNFHAECEMPPASEFKSMAQKAESKFDQILAKSVEGTQRNGGGVRKQLANRLAFRFNEGQCLIQKIYLRKVAADARSDSKKIFEIHA